MQVSGVRLFQSEIAQDQDRLTQEIRKKLILEQSEQVEE